MKTIDLCCGMENRRDLMNWSRRLNAFCGKRWICVQDVHQHLFGDDPNCDVTDETFKELVPDELWRAACLQVSRHSVKSVSGISWCHEGNHIFDIAEIIDRTMPQLFSENVENLVSHDKGQTFKIIKNTLEDELGITVSSVWKGMKRRTEVYDKIIHKEHEEFLNRLRVKAGIQRIIWKPGYLPKETPTEGSKQHHYQFRFWTCTFWHRGFTFFIRWVLVNTEKAQGQTLPGSKWETRLSINNDASRPFAHHLRLECRRTIKNSKRLTLPRKDAKEFHKWKCYASERFLDDGTPSGIIAKCFDKNVFRSRKNQISEIQSSSVIPFGNCFDIAWEMALFCARTARDTDGSRKEGTTEFPEHCSCTAQGLERYSGVKDEKPEDAEKCCRLVSNRTEQRLPRWDRAVGVQCYSLIIICTDWTRKMCGWNLTVWL